MTLEHVAIWTNQLEKLKDFYCALLEGTANEKYTNAANQFESYFISFKGEARLELMQRPRIPDNLNDSSQQYRGIIHLAFYVNTMSDVNRKAEQMRAAGFSILREPRKTGDGYYEFEMLDPDNNRLEVGTVWSDKG